MRRVFCLLFSSSLAVLSLTAKAFTLTPMLHGKFRRPESLEAHNPSTTRASTLFDDLRRNQRHDEDGDRIAELIGGIRYNSLVPIPDAMKETTAYVGNLCEFVHDQDLSQLFAQVSSLLTVPSCVVRKIDTTSLGYGFVAFRTVQEKEVCICVCSAMEAP